MVEGIERKITGEESTFEQNLRKNAALVIFDLKLKQEAGVSTALAKYLAHFRGELVKAGFSKAEATRMTGAVLGMSGQQAAPIE